MNRRVLRYVMSGVLLGAAVGCAGSEPEVQEASDVTALVAGAVDGGSDALIEGEVVITEAGCIAIETEEFAFVAVWPAGTTLHDDGGGLDVPDIGEVLVGQTLSAGGGYDDPPLDDALPQLPDACTGVGEGDEVAVIHEVSEVR